MERQGEGSKDLKMFEQKSFPLDCGDMLQNALLLKAAEGKWFEG